ncbi:hypothetical protein B0H13DRAFT_2326422 [Mycena leptocephala]|nr:hypothetical protein B0H13DRAFT_2326422 [Mycena leptocephala]
MPRNPDSPSPPPYEVNDLDQLLAGLSIAESTPPPTDITTLPHQSAAHPSPLYSYSTPTQTGFTSSWCGISSSCIHPLLTSSLRAEASALTQGVSGATPRRLTPKGKKKTQFPSLCCLLWSSDRHISHTEVKPLVSRLSNGIYKGYSTFELVQAAFKYARERGWTRTISSTAIQSTPLSTPTPLTRQQLPTPVEVSDGINPLHGDALDANWHVVYIGITPGLGMYAQYPQIELRRV